MPDLQRDFGSEWRKAKAKCHSDCEVAALIQRFVTKARQRRALAHSAPRH